MMRTAISPRLATRTRCFAGCFTGPRYSPASGRESTRTMVTVDLEQALLLADLTAPVRWDEVTGSTNATAMDLAAAGTPEWTLVAAGHQTQGRGRLGRAWVDRPGDSLMVSIVLRPALPVGDAGVLTLLAGAAWAGSARDLTGLDVRCKWPNDLVIDGRKVGGILTESVTGGDGELAHVVIGSGINIVPPTDVDDAAGLGEAVDPTELLGGFLRGFRDDYGAGGRGGSATSTPTLADRVRHLGPIRAGPPARRRGGRGRRARCRRPRWPRRRNPDRARHRVASARSSTWGEVGCPPLAWAVPFAHGIPEETLGPWRATGPRPASAPGRAGLGSAGHADRRGASASG